MYTFLWTWTWKKNNKQRPLFGLRALFSKVTNDSGALYNKLCFYYFSCCYCQWRHWKSDWKTPGAFYFSWPKLKRARKTNEKRLNTWWKTHKKRLFSHFPTLIYRVHAIFEKNPIFVSTEYFFRKFVNEKPSQNYIYYTENVEENGFFCENSELWLFVGKVSLDYILWTLIEYRAAHWKYQS